MTQQSQHLLNCRFLQFTDPAIRTRCGCTAQKGPRRNVRRQSRFGTCRHAREVQARDAAARRAGALHARLGSSGAPSRAPGRRNILPSPAPGLRPSTSFIAGQGGHGGSSGASRRNPRWTRRRRHQRCWRGPPFRRRQRSAPRSERLSNPSRHTCHAPRPPQGGPTHPDQSEPAGEDRAGHDELGEATAGHPPPLLRHPDGRTEFLRLPPELVLGIDPEADYPTTEITLPPGSALLVYSDTDGSQSGAPRLGSVTYPNCSHTRRDDRAQ
ncbi:serine/threonine-protein phosphatase [Streptomyces sp. INR7]|nr:serine/threonine-protein phosphatase [Streptomyces sp. INR7]